MKEKFNKNHLFTSTITIVLLLTIGFTSCEKETARDSKYADYEYLDLEFYNISRMTQKEFDKINEAMDRFELKKVNGMYNLKEVTPKEINISPKLFRYIVAASNYSNSILKPKLYKKTSKKNVRLKSGDPEAEYNEQTDNAYCMSHSIAYLGDYSFSECKEAQDEAGASNGNLVPYNPTTGVYDVAKVIEFFESFYSNATHTFGQNLDLEHGFLDKNVLVIRQTNFNLTTSEWEVTGSHAVNALSYNESTEEFHVYDNQKGRYTFVDKNDVIIMFDK